jgi:threonine dehydratase
MNRDIDLSKIDSAPQDIDPIFLNTPVASHASLDRVLSCTFRAKVETLNPIRSFKGRGTELFAARDLKAGEVVVCASAGNFGQGMARAATKRGHRCIVFAAERANLIKVEAMRSFGAELILTGNDFDAAKFAARAYAREIKARFVEDGAEPSIAEGAGTIGAELAQSVHDLDCLLVPLGNGALLAGVGAAFRHNSPTTKIVAVVAEQAPSMKLSLEQGRPVQTETASTIADGVAVRVPIPEALAKLQGRFDSILSVSEDQILFAMRLILEHLALAVEPAAALGVAAVLSRPEQFVGQSVATILCGANLQSGMLRQLVG